MFWFIAGFIASFVIAYATMPKPQTQKPPGIGDVTAPTAEAGKEIPVLFGTRDIFPNNVWYGDIKVVAIKKKGGKK